MILLSSFPYLFFFLAVRGRELLFIVLVVVVLLLRHLSHMFLLELIHGIL